MAYFVPLIGILASLAAEPGPPHKGAGAYYCQERAQNFTYFETEAQKNGLKVYSSSTNVQNAPTIIIGYIPNKTEQQIAILLGRYAWDNDTVLIDEYRRGENLEDKLVNDIIPMINCLSGKVRIEGATRDPTYLEEWRKARDLFKSMKEERTALSAVIHARVVGHSQSLEDEYTQFTQTYPTSTGKVYLLIDQEYVANGRFTLNLKRGGVKFVALTPPHDELEAAIKNMRVRITVRSGDKEVTFPYTHFGIMGAPLTLPEAVVIQKGKVEWRGEDMPQQGLVRGKAYPIVKRDIQR